MAYSLLTLNKLLGSCNKQEKEIDVKIHFSLKIALVLTWLILLLGESLGNNKNVQALPSLPQLPFKKLKIFDKSL